MVNEIIKERFLISLILMAIGYTIYVMSVSEVKKVLAGGVALLSGAIWVFYMWLMFTKF